MTYARGTSVSISKSRDELERTLERFGATGMLWLRDDEARNVIVGFKRDQRAYRFTIVMLTWEDCERTPAGIKRAKRAAEKAADQENRRRFRSLVNFVKAIMDAEDSGIINAEEALLPYLVLASGHTLADEVELQLSGKTGGLLSLPAPAEQS